MTWIEFINVILSVMIVVFTGAFGFIVNRMNKQEQNHREDIAKLFDEIKSLGSRQGESNVDLLNRVLTGFRELDQKLQDKYVTKEWCRIQHKGEE
jgi:hypothetical protein